MASQETLYTYWLGFAGGNDISATPTSPNVVALAFGVTDWFSTIGLDYLTSKYSMQEIAAGVKLLRSRGQKVVLSINGATNLEKGWSTLDPAQFASNAQFVVRSLGLDGIDLDNEDPGPVSPNFPLVIAALRAQLGPEALITLPVYMGIERDAYLGAVKDFITAVNTMAYWLDYGGQIALYEQYASVVGPAKVGIGVSNPGSGDNSTPLGAVSKLAQYVPSGGSKYGMMFWNLNSPSDPSQAAQWCQLISSNLPS